MFLIYSLCGGGAQRVLVDAVNALCEDEGLELTVRALFHDETYAKCLDGRVRYKAALEIRSALLRKIVSGFVQYIMPPSLTYWLLFRGQYDVEVAYMEAFPSKILAGSTNARAKKYAWVHIDVCAYEEQDRLFRSRAQQKRCYERFDKICCVSEGVRCSFVKKFGLAERTTVIYNILNEKTVYAQKGQRCGEIPHGKFSIVSVGSLVPRKGFDRLVRICGRLKREGFDVNTLVLGEGPQRTELSRMIEEEDLAGTFQLLGYRENPYPYLAKADLFVCPSKTEGFSTAVSEAVLLGLPVVAVDCAGMREILGQSEYGMVTENEEEALYEAVRQMIREPALRAQYSQKAAQQAKRLSMDRQVKAYREILLK